MHFVLCILFYSYKCYAQRTEKKSCIYKLIVVYFLYILSNRILHGRVNSVRWPRIPYDYIRNEHLMHIYQRYVQTESYRIVSYVYERAYMCVNSPHIAQLYVLIVIVVLVVCETFLYINMEIGYFIRTSTHVYAYVNAYM